MIHGDRFGIMLVTHLHPLLDETCTRCMIKKTLQKPSPTLQRSPCLASLIPHTLCKPEFHKFNLLKKSGQEAIVVEETAVIPMKLKDRGRHECWLKVQPIGVVVLNIFYATF